MRMERRLPGLRTSVREGADPARLHTLELRVKELHEVLPATCSFADSIRMVAEHRIKHDDMVMEIQGLEKKITETLEGAKVNAWKYAGRKDGPKEPAEVTMMRAQIATMDDRLDTMDEGVQPIMRILAAEEKAQAEVADVDAWTNRCFADPVPDCIIRMRAAEQNMLETGCERLRMPKIRNCIVVV